VNSETTDLQQIREYLLGRLPLDQQPGLEERLLVDSEFYEELLIAEDELVDQYVRGELPSNDRASFESHFITSPGRPEKVRFARTLRKYVSGEAPTRAQEFSASKMTADRPADLPEKEIPRGRGTERKSRWFGFLPIRNPAVEYAFAAALVLIVAGGGWWATRTFWTSRGPGNVFSVVLTPGVTRGDAAGAGFAVTSDVDTVRLQLLVPDNHYSSYEASLIDAGGRVLTAKNNLKLETLNGRQAVVLDVDRSLVPANDYRIKLNGAGSNGPEPVATYSFRVQSR
jgi:hypothetical protein